MLYHHVKNKSLRFRLALPSFMHRTM